MLAQGLEGVEGLIGVAAGCAVVLGATFAAVLAGYLVLTTVYSLGLKHVRCPSV